MCRSRNKLKLDPTLNLKRQLRGEIRRYEKEENKDKIKKVKKITKYTEIERKKKRQGEGDFNEGCAGQEMLNRLSVRGLIEGKSLLSGMQDRLPSFRLSECRRFITLNFRVHDIKKLLHKN